jgi:hypothetical protein
MDWNDSDTDADEVVEVKAPPRSHKRPSSAVPEDLDGNEEEDLRRAIAESLMGLQPAGLAGQEAVPPRSNRAWNEWHRAQQAEAQQRAHRNALARAERAKSRRV